jgi:pyruvate formate lyase activating enzyme
MKTKESHGLVFDIQRYSIKDGPGLRVLVFFKGCPLRCLWCSNPESQSSQTEILYDEDRCQGCGQCVLACQTKSLSQGLGGKVCHDNLNCRYCGGCIDACPSKARKWAGRPITVAGIMREVERDLPFFRRSGGGVTLGGGEPLSQPDFGEGILKACKEQNIHTSIETCGYAPWEVLKRLANYTDLFFYDLKQIDPGIHKQWTGVSNQVILRNLKQLATTHSQIVVRYPLIPKANDSDLDILALIKYIRKIKTIQRIEISPYHRYGELKYALLSREYPMKGVQTLPEKRIDEVVALIRSQDLDCESLH